MCAINKRRRRYYNYFSRVRICDKNLLTLGKITLTVLNIYQIGKSHFCPYPLSTSRLSCLQSFFVTAVTPRLRDENPLSRKAAVI